MRLNLKFREQLNQIGSWLTTELDQILAAIRGSWLVEHTEDDSHSDIHAYSLTLNKSADGTQSGSLTMFGALNSAGDIQTNGNVVAKNVTTPVTIGGPFDGLVSAGIRMQGGTNDWVINTNGGGGAPHSLIIRDVLDGSTGMLEIKRTGAGQFDIRPTGGCIVTLGTNAIKFDSAAVNLGYYERGRTPPMGEWTAYTPTVNLNGGALVTIGNGTIAGRYQLVGKTCTFQVAFTVGTTTNFGAGGILGFALPFTAASNFFRLGIGNAYLNVTAAEYGAIVFSNLGGGQTDCYLILPTGVSNWVTNGNPAAWAANDFLELEGTYEIA